MPETPPAPPSLRSGRLPMASVPDGCMLVVHGGAWDIPDEALADHEDGLRTAVEVGRDLLLEGASAVEVVSKTVASMEAHGAFDAGRGAVLTREGHIELDAGVMCGATLAYGAVAAVQHLAQPVLVATRLLETSDGQVRLLVGPGAEAFAQAAGFPHVENKDLVCSRERARYERLQREAAYHSSFAFLPEPSPTLRTSPSGTVGCVARDRAGRLAAATSTGGTPFRPSGRVGDSPLIGAGVYADAHAAASATGWGEAIMTTLLGARAADAVSQGHDPEIVVRERLTHMADSVRNPRGEFATGGLILLGADGNAAWGYTTPRMARAAWSEGGDLWLAI